MVRLRAVVLATTRGLHLGIRALTLLIPVSLVLIVVLIGVIIDDHLHA